METALPVNYLVGFLLALVRTTSWMAVSPPFNTRTIPRLVKLGIAAAISMALAPRMPVDQVTLETGPFLLLVLTQVVTGLILGFLTQLIFAAVGAAGQLIDILGGFTLSMAFDPMLNAQSSVFGRFYGLLATTLLFVTSGHLMLIKGFMTSFDAVPLSGLAFTDMETLIVDNIARFLVAALEIAGPLVAAYFLTEVALGLLSKAAPQLNVIMFGFPLKIFLTILLVSSALPLVPGAVDRLVDTALRQGIPLLGGG